ncbi:MAG TPA: PQQ-dependent sugar dehydrogenase [Thermoleophilaceae bacterium]|nr:PQQ-dependent sugar dehydrogenase [Thermoleophilaceae bacterium]
MTSRRAHPLLSQIVLGAAFGLLVGLAGCGGQPAESPARPSDEQPAPGERTKAREPERDSDRRPVRARGGPRVETMATGLDTPWEIAFLPDGRALVTERPGRVRLLSRDGRLRREPVAEPKVAEIGEGGLLGLAVDPRFRSNRLVYLYRTTPDDIEIVRYRLDGEELVDETKILGGIEVGPIHDSGRLRFGPDERLYINTGDAGDRRLAQNRQSLNGKTLRMEPDAYRGQGGRPEIFTLGHRNGQGLDWQPGSGRLFETEHGPVGFDEINILEQGDNYGWPEAIGGEQERSGFHAPIAIYEDSIAPSGASFVTMPGSEWTGDFLLAALIGEQLRRLSLDGTRVTENEPLLEGRYGRLRTVREGPDGALYVLTSNRDGRGEPEPEDDRVLRIVPPAG